MQWRDKVRNNTAYVVANAWTKRHKKKIIVVVFVYRILKAII